MYVAVTEIAPSLLRSFGLKIYAQLVLFFKGGKAGIDRKKEGAWDGTSHLVPNGQSCEAVESNEACGLICPVLPT